jgi:hypothetical protein
MEWTTDMHVDKVYVVSPFLVIVIVIVVVAIIVGILSSYWFLFYF